MSDVLLAPIADPGRRELVRDRHVRIRRAGEMIDFLAGNCFGPGELGAVLGADEVVRPAGDPADAVAMPGHPPVDFRPLVRSHAAHVGIFGNAAARSLPVFVRCTIWPPLIVVDLQFGKGLLRLVLGVRLGASQCCAARRTNRIDKYQAARTYLRHRPIAIRPVAWRRACGRTVRQWLIAERNRDWDNSAHASPALELLASDYLS